MLKSKILENIRKARVDHIKWLERARALVFGSLNVTKDEIPVEVTACDFSHWFYGEGQILLSILSEQIVKNVDQKHKDLHHCYMKIFTIYFDTTEESFFAKFLNRSKKISDTSQKLAESEFRNLENISEDLIGYLNVIERSVNQIDDEDLKELC